MEGDAGTRRLNPTGRDDPSPREVKTEDLQESAAGPDQTSTVVPGGPLVERADRQ